MQIDNLTESNINELQNKLTDLLKENPDIVVELAVSLSKFSTKLPRKRECSITQGDSCKIIDVVQRRLCFLTA